MKILSVAYIITWHLKDNIYVCVFMCDMEIIKTNYDLVLRRICTSLDQEEIEMSRLNKPIAQWPLLLTWFNFNPSMDK